MLVRLPPSSDPKSGLATVILIDVTEPSNPDECSEIDFSTVTKNIDTVQEGYLFTWRIGYKLNAAGEQGDAFNEFEFVTGTWTEAELADVREESKLISKCFEKP